MMGEHDPQKQLWSYQVNLDKRVRSDHPLRRIDETLELDFVRQEVAQFYGTKGNVSEDPVVIMKMMLLLFLDNVRSERELMRIIPERLDYMWFLGLWLGRHGSGSQRLEQSPQGLGARGFRCTLQPGRGAVRQSRFGRGH
jgi:transposase